MPSSRATPESRKSRSGNTRPERRWKHRGSGRRSETATEPGRPGAWVTEIPRDKESLLQAATNGSSRDRPPERKAAGSNPAGRALDWLPAPALKPTVSPPERSHRKLPDGVASRRNMEVLLGWLLPPPTEHLTAGGRTTFVGRLRPRADLWRILGAADPRAYPSGMPRRPSLRIVCLCFLVVAACVVPTARSMPRRISAGWTTPPVE